MQETAVYIRMKEYLRELIAQNGENPGYMLPSEKQLAIKFGSSRIPAKRALDDLREEGLIYRVRGKGSFIRSGDVEEPPRKKNVCLLAPDFKSGFIYEMAAGMRERLLKKGVNLFLVATADSSKLEEELIETALEKRFDGLVVFPVVRDEYNDALLKLAMRRFPAIFVGRKLPGLNISSISADHYKQTVMALDYLIEKGHRKIGFITECADASYCYGHRIAAYKETVLAKIGGEVRLCEVDFFDRSEGASERITAAVREFLDRNADLQALVTTNLAATAVFDDFRGRGVPPQRLPDMVVFDMPETDFAPYRAPVIVNQQPGEMGALAAEQLYGEMTGDTPKRQIVVESHLYDLETGKVIR